MAATRRGQVPTPGRLGQGFQSGLARLRPDGFAQLRRLSAVVQGIVKFRRATARPIVGWLISQASAGAVSLLKSERNCQFDPRVCFRLPVGSISRRSVAIVLCHCFAPFCRLHLGFKRNFQSQEFASPNRNSTMARQILRNNLLNAQDLGGSVRDRFKLKISFSTLNVSRSGC